MRHEPVTLEVDPHVVLKMMARMTTLQVRSLASAIEELICGGLVGPEADAIYEVHAAQERMLRACKLLDVDPSIEVVFHDVEEGLAMEEAPMRGWSRGDESPPTG